jgi:PAS domain S-box-containing protein
MVSPQHRARLPFGSAVALLLLSGASAYVTISRFLTAEQAVSHTREVQTALGDVTVLFGRARRAQIQYLDSGAPNYLKDYQSAINQLSGTVQRVRTLTADNSTQQSNCDQLERLTSRRIGILAAAMQTDKSDLAQQANITRQLVATASETDTILGNMDAVEQHLLDLRSEQASRLFHVSAALLGVAFVLALGLLLLHYRLLHAELDARQSAEAKFRRLLESAPDAIVVAGPEGKILLTNAQTEKLFGYRPEELQGREIDMLVPERFRGAHPVHRADFFREPRVRAHGRRPRTIRTAQGRSRISR